MEQGRKEVMERDREEKVEQSREEDMEQGGGDEAGQDVSLGQEQQAAVTTPHG